MENSKDGTTVRQNSMYPSSRKHEANLRRNPTLHFQIGLILALLASIFFIEMRTPEQAIVYQKIDDDVDQVFTIDQVQVEKPKVTMARKVILPKPVEPIIIDKTPEKPEQNLTETFIDPTEPSDQPMVDPGFVDYADPVEEPATIFSLVETVPLFPGCEGLNSNDERRDCMSTKISKFVSKKFRTDRGEGLGLTGINRIFVTFKINKNGEVVDVQAKAPHPKLEEEAKRVTQLLPNMTAGKQGGKDVAVLFSLPISFQIQD